MSNLILHCHDKTLIYGKAKMVTAGVIKAPSITSVEIDTATSKAVVTAANNSEIPDTILAVLFRAASDPSQIYTLGIIAHGIVCFSICSNCIPGRGESGKCRKRSECKTHCAYKADR